MPTTAKNVMERFTQPEEWDRVDHGVRVLVEHDRWWVPPGVDPDRPSGYRTATLPDQAPPAGAKFLYKVDRKRLEHIAANAKLHQDHYRTPAVQMLAHHSVIGKEKNPRSEQVGFYINPRVEEWNGKAALSLDRFIEKGCLPKLKDLTQRSIEFFAPTNRLVAVASVPVGELPLGVDSYAATDAELECYAADFSGLPNDPTAPATSDDLTPEQWRLWQLGWAKAQREDPGAQMVAEMARQAQQPTEPTAPAPPAATATAPEGQQTEPSQEMQQMSATITPELYQAKEAELAAAKEKIQTYEAERSLARFDAARVKLSPLQREKLTKRLKEADDKSRAEIEKEVIECYEKTPKGDVAPVGLGHLKTDDDATAPDLYAAPTYGEIEAVMHEHKWATSNEQLMAQATAIAKERKRGK